MIKDLLIKNLVLMDSCHIRFGTGLNIITGETGAGKTAVLHGLKLLCGRKQDISLIRRGQTRGLVQARFDVTSSSDQLKTLLEEAGIELEEESSLLLSREISSEGKSKCQINDRLVSLALLQKVASCLIQITDQHSYYELRSSESQRELLDLFASLQKEVKTFKTLFEEEKRLNLLKAELAEAEKQKERELDFCLAQAEELDSLTLEEGEEEKIFQEYSLISESQEILSQTDRLFSLLDGEKDSVLSKTIKAKSLCSTLAGSHAIFQEPTGLLEQSVALQQEALRLLQKALSSFDTDSGRSELLEQKLRLIDIIKKKYGASLSDRVKYRFSLKKKIERFDSLEEEKLKLESNLCENQEKLSFLAKELSQKRTLVAKETEERLTKGLRELNMPTASVFITVEKQERTSSGEDFVSFWMSPNPGEGRISVKESSSGGELSRLLLATKTLLAGKNGTSTLIFDEIDANVGGETAGLIGEKLRDIASHGQVICITHFPQVACLADLHLRVKKSVTDDRTIAVIEPLDVSLREIELLRMLGGEKTLSFYSDT